MAPYDVSCNTRQALVPGAAAVDAGFADVRRSCGEGLAPMRDQCARMNLLGDDELLRAVAAGPDPAKMPVDVLTAMFPGRAWRIVPTTSSDALRTLVS